MQLEDSADREFSDFLMFQSVFDTNNNKNGFTQ